MNVFKKINKHSCRVVVGERLTFVNVVKLADYTICKK